MLFFLSYSFFLAFVSGDLHIAIYDLTNMVLHTANARRDGASGPAMAYDRAFVRLDMTAAFAVTP